MHIIDDLQAQIHKLQEQKRKEIQKLKNHDTSHMTKHELIDYVKTLPSIPDDLYDDMCEYGFVTGSSIYGNISNPADLDYVTGLPARAFLVANCAVACSSIAVDYIDEIKDDEQFVPLYAHRDRIVYNLICIGSFDKFNAWKKATDLMTQLSQKPELKDEVKIKWKRVRLFRALCDVLEPVKSRYRPMPFDKAIEYSRCTICHREAINFTCKATKDEYYKTAICERCQGFI